MSGIATMKTWRLALLGVLALGGVWLVFRWLAPPFIPPVLPQPNGYDDLLRAAKMLAPRTGYYSEMAAEELADVVDHNAPALELLHAALRKECMVVVDWSPGQNGFATAGDNCSLMRELARALAAAAKQANVEGRSEQAILYGLESLELAQKTAHGGLVVDRLMAMAVRFFGLMTLRNQVADLTSDDCAALLAELAENVRLQLEPIDAVIRRDLAYARKVHGFTTSLMITAVARSQVQQTKDAMRESERRAEALESLLRTHLALRIFHIKQQHWPESLEALVPDYLPAIPQDPFAAGPLVYRLQADSYLVYSVGPDGVDGGGVETNTQGNRVDLLLEAS